MSKAFVKLARNRREDLMVSALAAILSALELQRHVAREHTWYFNPAGFNIIRATLEDRLDTALARYKFWLGQ